MTDVHDDPMPDDPMVQRLHALLAQALHRSRTQPFDSPVTVAEIYQDLVPYREVRTALGFQMNADYEHTLLRMLAGEGEFARLEPAEARDELRAELQTPNPNVGLFRKFAGCDVWVTPGVAAEIHVAAAEAGAPAPASVTTTYGRAPDDPARHEPTGMWGGNAAAGAAAESDLDEWESSLPELILEEVVPAEPTIPEPTPPEPAPAPAQAQTSQQPEATTMFEAAASPAARAATSPGSCAFCASDLPAGRMIKYCPFCGADQALQPCVTCAEPLEPGWRFCIACGSRQDQA